MGLKIPDEFGIVTERARQREVFADKVARRVEAWIFSPAGQATIARKVDARVREEVDAIIERRKAEQVAEVEKVALPSGPPVGEVLVAVSDVTGCTVPNLLGPRRSRNIVYPRHLVFHILALTRHDLSLPAIGRAIGGRDHTTVMHALKVFAERQHDEPYARWLADDRIKALLAMAPDKERETRPHKITVEQAREIRASRLTNREVAEKYGISENHAGEVRRGVVWKDAA